MFREVLRQAWSSIRSNALRAGLTVAIIAFGITAIVGVLVSIDAIRFWMQQSFTTLGTNTFKVVNRASTVRVGGGTKRIKYPAIPYAEAEQFVALYAPHGQASVMATGTHMGQARYGGQETRNNVEVQGVDERNLAVEAYTLAFGRSLTADDVRRGTNACIIGWEINNLLFPYGHGVGRDIQVGRNRYQVVGVLAELGATMSGGDRVIKIPITTLMRDYPEEERSFTIVGYVPQAAQVGAAVEVATGLMRLVRGLRPREENNFAVLKSDSFIDNLMSSLAILTVTATLVAAITLVGAGIGLMNIMLVSVTERTREIGTRKALGATRAAIRTQFLTEAVTICLMGGTLGIVLSLGIGLAISLYLNVAFAVPWGWIVLGYGVSGVVGVISGYYPANKAAGLDPISALRHE